MELETRKMKGFLSRKAEKQKGRKIAESRKQKGKYLETLFGKMIGNVTCLSLQRGCE